MCIPEGWAQRQAASPAAQTTSGYLEILRKEHREAFGRGALWGFVCFCFCGFLLLGQLGQKDKGFCLPSRP